jgi:DNA mismatch repair protein MutS
VVARAEEVLAALEQGEQGRTLAKLADDLPLFQAAAVRPDPAMPDTDAGPGPAEALLAEINPDDLTPREALEWLYRLKGASG